MLFSLLLIKSFSYSFLFSFICKWFVIHLYAYILRPHNQIYIYAHFCTLLGSDILTFTCLTINKQTLLKTRAYTPMYTFYIYTHIFMNTKLSASLYTTKGNYQVYNHMAPLTWLAPTNILKETTSIQSSMVQDLCVPLTSFTHFSLILATLVFHLHIKHVDRWHVMTLLYQP